MVLPSNSKQPDVALLTGPLVAYSASTCSLGEVRTHRPGEVDNAFVTCASAS